MTGSLDRPRSRGPGVGPVGRSGPQHPADPLQRVGDDRGADAQLSRCRMGAAGELADGLVEARQLVVQFLAGLALHLDVLALPVPELLEAPLPDELSQVLPDVGDRSTDLAGDALALAAPQLAGRPVELVADLLHGDVRLLLHGSGQLLLPGADLVLQRVQLVLAALQLGQPGLGQRVDLPASGLLPVHQSLGGQPVQPRVDGAGGRCVQAEEVVLQQADHVVTAAWAVAQDAQQVQPELAVTEDALHADGPSAAGAVRSRVTRPRSARAVNRPAPPPRVPLAVLPPRPPGPGITSGNALTISPCTVDSSTFRFPGSRNRTVMSPTRQVSARSVASPPAPSSGSARSTMCEPWMQCALTAPRYPWTSPQS